MKKSVVLVISTAVAVTSVVAIGYTQRPGSGDAPSATCLSAADLQLSASPAVIQLGESTMVRWSVVVPAGCEGLQLRLNGSPVSASGSHTFKPGAPASYSLHARTRRSRDSQERTVKVHVRVQYPEHVVIDRNTPAPADVLLGALASSNHRQVIELCDVDLDLTGRSYIVISDRRSLIAAPRCARGARGLKSRVFVTDTTRGKRPLFIITGDSVQISGFRLQGPSGWIIGRQNRGRAILVAPLPGSAPLRSVEISNMQISHWGGPDVQILDHVKLATAH